jgi:hypothetical protein
MRTVPISVLQERYIYNPETGKISARIKLGKKDIGEEVGTINHDGYIVLKVSYDGRRTQIAGHVLAWTLFYGEYPEFDVDHRDTVRTNNRIDNLRNATRSQNLANRNHVGELPRGVTRTKNKNRPYQAQIQWEGKKRYLGSFADPMDAHAAYVKEATLVFADFVRI